MLNHNFNWAYCTNIWTHHQAPVCMEFVRLLGEDHFKMFLFEPVHEERLKLGWDSALPDYPWIERPPTSSGDLQRLSRIVCGADVAVLGDCPPEVEAARVKTGKTTFIFGERLWKKPFYRWRMLNPRFARGVKRFKAIANRLNVHYLAIGAYAAGDVRMIDAYGKRIWTWAYFVEVAPESPKPRVGGQVRVLWVGRMLDWKRVDLLLKAVALVCRSTGFGGLDLVGYGPEKKRLLKLARNLGLGDKCIFHNPVPANHVRQFMRQSNIYVLPSNRHEGWGLVANEAMSEGAVLVANEQAGAAPMLIDHGRTGFLFKNGDVAGLADILRTLIANVTIRETVRQAAWHELNRLWHPRVGAERLVGLCQGLLGLAPLPEHTEGPCSQAATE